MNFYGTYKLGKHVYLAARHNEILAKTKRIISIFQTHIQLTATVLYEIL